MLTGDDQPQLEFPWITIGTICVCIVVFFGQYHWLLPLFRDPDPNILLGFACIPARVLGHMAIPLGLAHAPAVLTPLTSAFLHGNAFHIAGNMMFLWIFGRHVEDSFGWPIYLGLIAIGAYASNGAEILAHRHSEDTYIGASGFIAAIMGAYIAVFPRAKLRFGWFAPDRSWFSYKVPAWTWLGYWIVYQIIGAYRGDEARSHVAILAHIAGFFTGAVIGRVLFELQIVATYDPEMIDDH